jgi:hypothetical protein
MHKRLILLTTALVAMLLGVSTADARLDCRGIIHGYSEGATPFAIRSRKDAEKFARENWVGNCVNNYPLQWCDITLAKNPKMECKRVPNGFGGYNHSCTFRAESCHHQ